MKWRDILASFWRWMAACCWEQERWARGWRSRENAFNGSDAEANDDRRQNEMPGCLGKPAAWGLGASTGRQALHFHSPEHRPLLLCFLCIPYVPRPTALRCAGRLAASATYLCSIAARQSHIFSRTSRACTSKIDRTRAWRRFMLPAAHPDLQPGTMARQDEMCKPTKFQKPDMAIEHLRPPTIQRFGA